MTTTRLKAVLLSASVIGLAALPAHATPATVAQTLSLPVSVTLTPTLGECTNTGSSIVLDGAVTQTGIALHTVFKNNTKGTKEVVVGDVTTPVSDASTQTIPKQPVLGGVGGNPYISVAVGTGSPDAITLLTTPRIVGRCVQGQSLATVTQSMNLPTPASALATGLVCDSKGSTVDIAASATTGDLFAVILFDNNKNKVVHREMAAGTAIAPLASGTTHKGWGQSGGAGGNPLVYLRFADGNSTDSVEWFIGRCKDLM